MGKVYDALKRLEAERARRGLTNADLPLGLPPGLDPPESASTNLRPQLEDVRQQLDQIERRSGALIDDIGLLLAAALDDFGQQVSRLDRRLSTLLAVVVLTLLVVVAILVRG